MKISNQHPSVNNLPNDDSDFAANEPTLIWQDQLPTEVELDLWKQQIGDIQHTLVEHNPTLQMIDRGFHQKQLYGGIATVKVRSDLPKILQFGPFAAGSDGQPPMLDAAIRFSNGQGCPFRDAAPDVRGIALKMIGSDATPWDVLATNKQTFAKDPEQFMRFARINAIAQTTGTQLPESFEFLAGQSVAGLALTAELLKSTGRKLKRMLGIKHTDVARDWDATEAARIVAALTRDTVLHTTHSLATEHYDGGTFQTPDGYLAKVLFTPDPSAKAKPVNHNTPNYLSDEFAQQLQDGPVHFTMQVKIYTGNGDSTIAHDDWEPARIFELADLEIPLMDAKQQQAFSVLVNKMAFNPGNGFQPAEMSHARKAIYQESAKNRGALSQAEAVAAIQKFR